MEMLKFKRSLEYVLENEGGYVCHKNDPGGATNLGISIRLLKDIGEDINDDGVVDKEDIKSLSKEDASRIYKEVFWDKYGYEKIDDLDISRKIFDMSVNMGPSRSHKIAQIALNRLGETLFVDGIIGPKTIGTINEHSKNAAMLHVLYKEICECCIHFYVNLAADRPKLAVFLKGWLKRARH